MRFLKYIPVFLTLALASCTEVIDVDLQNGEPKLVIEGGVTNEKRPFEVKLSLSRPYFSEETAPSVENSFVEISDKAGNNYQLFHKGKGIYRTNDSLQGVPGMTYSLKVLHDGQVYTASSYLDFIHPVDSLGYIYREESIIYEEGYYIMFYAQEKTKGPDFYRFDFIRNGIRYPDLNLADDGWVNGNYITLEIGYPVQKNDTVTVEMLSLSREEFNYLSAVSQQTTQTGGPFGVPLANPVNNISNGGLGFFGARAVASKTIIIR